MKNLIVITISIFLIAGCAGSQPQSDDVIVSVDTKKFKELVDSGNGIVLDVRTPEEVKEGYIAGAEVIDFYSDDFETKVTQLPKDKEIYVYCSAGGRSMKAARILEKNGYNKVYNLKDGSDNWIDAGYPLVQ